jgi:hypothetical protein
MQQISLQPMPSQQLQIVLGGQNCQIAIYQKTTGLYVDLNLNGVDISTAVLARDVVPLVPTTYLGFVGNLVFTDTQGYSDPTYDGLGGRYQLVYLTEPEYQAAAYIAPAPALTEQIVASLLTDDAGNLIDTDTGDAVLVATQG